MIFLPNKLRIFYQGLADQKGLNLGEFIYYFLRVQAENLGFGCIHPTPLQVLHKKRNGPNQAIWRCTSCGYLYFKNEHGDLSPKVI